MNARDRLIASGFEVPDEISRGENRFFDPTTRCPHPERWHSHDGDSTEVEVTEFIAALVRVLQPDLVVETGTAFGQTALAIGHAILMNGRGDLITFEHDPLRAQYARELIPATLRVEIIEARSFEWELPQTADIGLLFSDSDMGHRVPEVKHFLRWMRKGAVVAIHDSNNKPLKAEVQRQLISRRLLRAIELPTPRGLMLCEVL